MNLPRLSRSRNGRAPARAGGRGGPAKSAGRGRAGGKAGASAAATGGGVWDEILQRRGVAARLLMTALACAACVAAARAWEPALPYRLGDFSGDGIAARVPFAVENDVQTASRRTAAAAAVPEAFRNDPAVLDPLVPQFRQQLETLGLTESWEQVPAPIRAAFGLGVDGAADPAAAERAARNQFSKIRIALLVQDGGAGDDRPAAPERLDALTREFRTLLDALGEVGTLTPAALQTADLSADRPILILANRPDGSGVPNEPGAARPPAVAGTEVTAQARLIEPLLQDTQTLDPVWNRTPGLSQVKAAVSRWLIRNAPATLRFDPAATAAARAAAAAAAEPAVTQFVRGQQLVPPGSVVGPDALELLIGEHAALVAVAGPVARLTRAAVVAGVLLVLAGLIGYFLRRNAPDLIREPGRLAAYLGLVVAAVAVGRWLSFDPWRAEAVPILVCAMTFAVAYDPWLAALTGLAVSAVVVFNTTADLGHLLILSAAAAAAVLPLARVASRSTVIKVGFFAAAVSLAVSLAVGLTERAPLADPAAGGWDVVRPALMNGLRNAAWCLFAGYLVAGSLPFIERSFGVVTDISLLEMSDVSHPLLQELVRKAPGTYNHSIAMATIGETAADVIGANGLLLRVAAYYHDAGKMNKPHYFIENQTAEDRKRHDELAPAMSTLIIIGHVRDGVDLARRHGLPQRIIDFIEQHHGTTLVKFFFHKAGKAAELTPGHEGDAEESAFRYPGPKPQTREAGVMMLADAVESATRSLSDPTPGRIENLVKSITMDRLLDGQFDESSLTLREIRIVEASLVKSLIGMHHGRIKYPDQKVA